MLTTQKSEKDYIQQVQQNKDSGYGGKYIICFNRPVLLSELEQVRGALGLGVERDLYWTAKPLSQCK